MIRRSLPGIVACPSNYPSGKLQHRSKYFGVKNLLLCMRRVYRLRLECVSHCGCYIGTDIPDKEGIEQINIVRSKGLLSRI